MDVTWTHTVRAKIDPKKLAKAFDEEWLEFKKRRGADYSGFALETAEIMGEDLFDGPWCVITDEGSEFEW